MKTFLLLLSVIVWHSPVAQDYIGDSKKVLKRKMERYMKSNQYKQYQVAETDTSIVYHLREEKVQHVDFCYQIDPKGVCFATITSSPCFECVDKNLKSVLEQKRYGWKQLSNNTWISDYKHCLQLTLARDAAGSTTLEIRKMLWSKRLHAELLPPEK